jgi:hypothetical protein
VRYLSFLGIGRNVKQCAFIMHTAQDLFIAHVFNCEPSSGALCKTIEAACKVTILNDFSLVRERAQRRRCLTNLRNLRFFEAEVSEMLGRASAGLQKR